MYKDNSLIPSEALRLAALGLLARSAYAYADLARDIRHFTARIAGPSLDLLGPSLTLLAIEGLIAADDSKAPLDRQILHLTETGRAELLRLMTATLRGPMSEVNKLIVALKIYFLDLLDKERRKEQLSMLIEVSERECARLQDLRNHVSEQSRLLVDWLDHEIAEAKDRCAWFERTLTSQ